MNKEKCSKCCFDLKDEKQESDCIISCYDDLECRNNLITCYTFNEVISK